MARVGGSVGGTLPLRSVPARVPGVTRYTKQQLCRQLAHGPTPCTAGVSGASVCRCPLGVHPPLGAACAVWPWLVCHTASSIPAPSGGQKQGLWCGPSFTSGQHLPSGSSSAQKTYVGNGHKA